MNSRFVTLDQTLYDYVLAHGVREHPEQVALRAATRRYPNSGMQISPEQGQLMALLVQLIGARNTIEVGVFTGYSALSVALALPTGGRVLARIIDDKAPDVGRPHWERAGVADRHTLLPASAFEVDWGGPYDLVLLTNFLHHFDEPTCTAFLREIKPPGFVLLGAGPSHALPSAEVRKLFAEARVGLEPMSTGAAARTFNVLLAEGRDVSAGLIAVE